MKARRRHAASDLARRPQPGRAPLALPFVMAACLALASPAGPGGPVPPTPTLDRLAAPAMPEHPTLADLGRGIYYTNCMPCHGDVGQGLTDEWRAVWVEDHQNCWARGCHGGRMEEEGFPLPPVIPAVIGPAANAARFPSSVALRAYLQQTHPPQQPGALEAHEYDEVTAFLWQENGRPVPAVLPPAALAAAGVGLLTAAAYLVLRARRRG